MSAIRARSSLERGEEDLLQWPGNPRERDEDDRGRERVRTQRRCAKRAADHEAADVAACLVDEVLTEDVPGETTKPAKGSDGERRRRPPRRHTPEEHGRRDRFGQLLADDRPSPEALDGDRNADDRADEGRGDLP
jgi:hypothetical protein